MAQRQNLTSTKIDASFSHERFNRVAQPFRHSNDCTFPSRPQVNDTLIADACAIYTYSNQTGRFARVHWTMASVLCRSLCPFVAHRVTRRKSALERLRTEHEAVRAARDP